MVMLRLPDVNMVGHGNASAILGRVAAAMRPINGVMPDFAIERPPAARMNGRRAAMAMTTRASSIPRAAR
jgi:hypothetical protein